MYVWFVYALLSSIAIYSLLTTVRKKDPNEAGDGTKHSVPTFFFILMISITLFYYLGSATDSQSGGAFETEQLVGLAPF